MKKFSIVFVLVLHSFCLLGAAEQEINKSALVPLAYQHKKWMILLSSISGKNHYNLLSSYTKQNPKGFKNTSCDFSKKIGYTYTPRYLKIVFDRQREISSNLVPLKITTEHNISNFYPVYVDYKSLKALRENTPKNHHGKPKMHHRWFTLRRLISVLNQGEDSITLENREVYIDPTVKEVLTDSLFALPRKDLS